MNVSALAPRVLVPLLGLVAGACSHVPRGAIHTGGIPAVPLAVESFQADGEIVTIRGRGFTSNGDTRIAFGPYEARFVRVIDESHMEVLVPEGAGRVDVCLANANGSAVLEAAFSFSAGAADDGGSVLTCWPHGSMVDAPWGDGTGEAGEIATVEAPADRQALVAATR